MKNAYQDGFQKGLEVKDNCNETYSSIVFDAWCRYAGMGPMFYDMVEFTCGQYDGAVFRVMVNF